MEKVSFEEAKGLNSQTGRGQSQTRTHNESRIPELFSAAPLCEYIEEAIWKRNRNVAK
jgi:hypothetical protein